MAKIVGTPGVIKLLNKDVVEGIIRKSKSVSRPEIAKKSELGLVTVNKIVDILCRRKRSRRRRMSSRRLEGKPGIL